jgi:hypothetical protein
MIWTEKNSFNEYKFDKNFTTVYYDAYDILKDCKLS